MESDYTVNGTAARSATLLKSNGFKVFAHIDHSKEAEQVGLELRPTTLVGFGKPKVGTVLMQDNHTSGLDLPAKVLVWEDEFGKYWLSYNDPSLLKSRQSLSEDSDTALQALANGIEKVCTAATKE